MPAPGRSARRPLAIAAVVVLALVAGIGGWLLHGRTASTPAAQAPAPIAATYVADAQCASCHQAAADAWRHSNHERAMQPATAATVAGNFDDASLTHLGATMRFTRRDGRYFITMEGPDGKPAEYEVKYTFGVEPLQQYLVAYPGGRLQAPTVAWDTANKRWFAMYPNDRHKPDDPLHSTGRYQNWNLMCSECHSTDLHRRYDAKTDTYDTKWAELSVGCQACHGPGSAHVAWAAKPGAKDAKGLGANALGLVVDFRGTDSEFQVEACAPCHSRRQRLTDGEMPGRPFLDNYRPALLREGLYYADGQQRDEVYVWGSFVQSKMYARGVRCTDCHDPHKATLKAQGNALCTQCHQSAGNARFPTLKKADYDTPAHHHHEPASPGARCANCHIPVKNYMVIDPRPDHSFRVPRPDLSVKLGTPNACSGCHEKEGAQWAADAVAKWYGPARRQEPTFAFAFAAARDRKPEAAAALANVIADRGEPAIIRATALDLIQGYGAAGTQPAIDSKNDVEALVRAAAASALVTAPPEQRLLYVAPLLKDPVRLVRIQAARTLADVPAARIPAEVRGDFDRAYADLIASEETLADSVGAQLNLAALAAQRGDAAAAEAGYRRALTMDPYLEPAWSALASFLSAAGRNAEAERVLRDGLARIPDDGRLRYSLGLLLAEEERLPEAIAETRKAATLLRADGRVAYNLGLMLQKAGQLPQAEVALAQARALGENDATYALALLYARQGKRAQALPLAEALVQSNVGNPEYTRLRDELRGAAAPGK
jgi:predicted CXXCH cytochrome family protein